MSVKINSYIDRLTKFYSFWNDEQSIKDVQRFADQEGTLIEMEQLRDNPHAQRMIQSAIARWKACANRLVSDTEMSLETRKLIFVEMDWAQWYIKAMGGDLTKARTEIERALESRIADMESYEKIHRK